VPHPDLPGVHLVVAAHPLESEDHKQAPT
jgi:hypothetical protein